MIGTVQYIQWNIFNNQSINGIATRINGQPAIVNINVPFRWHNGWIFTLGNQYRISSKWIVRAAGSYVQSPGNPNYQLSNGDSLVLGVSSGYQINKFITIDGSYAHVFIKQQDIHIANNRSIINGTTSGYRNAISLKLTLNV